MLTQRAGRLRRRVTIQQPTETRDSTYGEPVPTWSTYRVRWAEVLPVPGSERFVGDREEARQVVRFQLRYLAGVTPKMRISWDGRTFGITSIQNVEERNKMLWLDCEEVDTSS